MTDIFSDGASYSRASSPLVSENGPQIAYVRPASDAGWSLHVTC